MSNVTVNMLREFELDVSVDYYPASKGRREHGSGVQLEPDEPASIEICSVSIVYVGKDGNSKSQVIELPEEILQELEDEAVDGVNAALEYDGED